LLDGLEKIFDDSLMAAKITDNGRRAALVFVVDGRPPGLSSVIGSNTIWNGY
jgi:hypothetical protein